MGVAVSTMRWTRRTYLAVAFTIVAATLVEWVSIHRGSSAILEGAMFAIPAAAAFFFYRTLASRAVALVGLTLLAFVSAATLIVLYLTV